MAELHPKNEVEGPVAPPRVRVSVGYTRNMGDFESLRYDVSVEASPLRGENTNEAFERIADFVENKLMAKLAEVEEELKGDE